MSAEPCSTRLRTHDSGRPAGRGLRGDRGDRRRRAGPTSARSGRPPRCCGAGCTRPTSPTTRAPRCGCPAWPRSVAALAAGLEPVMQMTSRDRNRIALQSDLLAAGALGVPNLLTDDRGPARAGRPRRRHAGVRPQLRRPDAGRPRVAGRRRAAVRPRGRPAAAVPARRRGHRRRHAGPAGRQGRRRRRVRADPVRVRRARVRAPGWPGCASSGWTGRCAILAGVGPVRSLRALEFLAGDPRGGRSRTRWSGGCAGCRRTGWPRRAWRPARRRWPRCASCPGWPGCT